MRLQQSRSAAVIAIAGMRQAIIGVANTRSNSNETPTLLIGFICLKSIGLASVGRNTGRKTALVRVTDVLAERNAAPE